MTDLVRVFNTALLSTRGQEEGALDLSELQGLLESAPLRAILNSIRQLARSNGISDRQAAEQVIRAFRRVDRIWMEYVFQEGLDRLKTRGSH
ncbi:MAG: hypothetical protein NDJ90_06460 [Oligoflexia bacterium]|nr:hypothetical protein [Oligoflexia bacterium]